MNNKQTNSTYMNGAQSKSPGQANITIIIKQNLYYFMEMLNKITSIACNKHR